MMLLRLQNYHLVYQKHVIIYLLFITYNIKKTIENKIYIQSFTFPIISKSNIII